MTKPTIPLLAVLLALAACTEKPQTSTARKVDDKAWENSVPGFLARDFKAGDKGAWEAHVKARAQGQNEYNRTAPR